MKQKKEKEARSKAKGVYFFCGYQSEAERSGAERIKSKSKYLEAKKRKGSTKQSEGRLFFLRLTAKRSGAKRSGAERSGAERSGAERSGYLKKKCSKSTEIEQLYNN